MSVKEKYLRRLLRDAEFYLNNIDNDDPKDPVGDVKKAGAGGHPIDTFVGTEEAKDSKNEEVGFNYLSYSQPQVLEKSSSLNSLLKQKNYFMLTSSQKRHSGSSQEKQSFFM